MSTTTPTVSRRDVRSRLDELIGYIRAGRILDAMHEFYAPNVQMQENANPPTVGLGPNIEREKQFVASVKEWRRFDVGNVAVSGDTSAYESVLEFIGTDGKTYHTEQVSVAQWRDGKIVHERFYYNAGQ